MTEVPSPPDPPDSSNVILVKIQAQAGATAMG